MKAANCWALIGIGTFLIAACSPPGIVPDEDIPDGTGTISSPGNDCASDSDCTRGGCSGTICQSRSEEPAISTCEWLPEYECFQQITCGCAQGSCKWKTTKAFDRCVEEKRESSDGPIF